MSVPRQSGNPGCMILGKVSDANNLRVERPAAVAKIKRGLYGGEKSNARLF